MLFNNISMAGTGWVGVIVYLIVLVGQHFGVSIAEAELTAQIANIVGFVGFVLGLIGQFRRKDLSVGLIRK